MKRPRPLGRGRFISRRPAWGAETADSGGLPDQTATVSRRPPDSVRSRKLPIAAELGQSTIRFVAHQGRSIRGVTISLARAVTYRGIVLDPTNGAARFNLEVLLRRIPPPTPQADGGADGGQDGGRDGGTPDGGSNRDGGSDAGSDAGNGDGDRSLSAHDGEHAERVAASIRALAAIVGQLVAYRVERAVLDAAQAEIEAEGTEAERQALARSLGAALSGP